MDYKTKKVKMHSKKIMERNIVHKSRQKQSNTRKRTKHQKVVQKRVDDYYQKAKAETTENHEETLDLQHVNLNEWEQANLSMICQERNVNVGELVAKLYRDLTTNIYYDVRDGTTMKKALGITKLLSSIYYPRPIEKNIRKVRRKKGSSKKKGSQFHRRMYHTIMCENKNHGNFFRETLEDDGSSCVCSIKYGDHTHTKESPSIRLWMDQAFDVLRQHGIRPYKSEMIVFGQGIATEIDMIAWKINRNGTRELCNISLKTGYSLSTLKNQDSPPKFRSPLSVIKNSYFEQHQLQQHVENLLLKEYHGVEISHANNFILYVGLDEKRAILEPASEWRKDEQLSNTLMLSLRPVNV